MCPLIWAEHSQQGLITLQLPFDDEIRVDLASTQLANLTFLPSIPYKNTAHFTFEINGYNAKTLEP